MRSIETIIGCEEIGTGAGISGEGCTKEWSEEYEGF